MGKGSLGCRGLMEAEDELVKWSQGVLERMGRTWCKRKRAAETGQVFEGITTSRG